MGSASRAVPAASIACPRRLRGDVVVAIPVRDHVPRIRARFRVVRFDGLGLHSTPVQRNRAETPMRRLLPSVLPRRGSVVFIAALGLFGASAAHASVDCAGLKPPVPAVANALQSMPIAEELAAPNAQIGAGVGFAQLYAEGTTVELVLARVKHQECRATAALTQPQPGAAGSYQPQSNDPQAWRFNMTQNGRRMTADEFDAWMKARGVRVVQGPPKPAAEAPPPPPPPAPEPPKKKRR
jgi:hypothetical protein